MEIALRSLDGEIYLQSHKSLDVDAVNSLILAKSLIEELNENLKIKIVVDRNIGKISCEKILREYLGDFEDFVYAEDLKRVRNLFLVDCQYGEGNVWGVQAENVICIDHHIEKREVPYLYKDVREERCSTTAILLDYFVKYLGGTNQEQSNLIYMGMYTDTNSFSRQGSVGVADVNARMSLEMGRETSEVEISKIDFNEVYFMLKDNLKLDNLLEFISSLNRFKLFEEESMRHMILIEPVCDDNMLGYVSDMFLEVEDVRVVVAYTERADGYKVSVRSIDKYEPADEIIEYLVDGVGTGGGTKFMAGGFVRKDRLREVNYTSMGRFTEERLQSFSRSFDVYESGKEYELDWRKVVKEEIVIKVVKVKDVVGMLEKEYRGAYEVFISTLEGNVRLKPDAFGEMYPMGDELLRSQYEETDALTSIEELDGLEGFRLSFMVDGEVEDITPDMYKRFKSYRYVGKEQRRALELEKRAKVLTKWDSRNPNVGEVGDFLLYRKEEEEYYVVARDIFFYTFGFVE